MAALAAPVAAVRHAVRAGLHDCRVEGGPAGPPLALVACSGGADSLALAAATAFVAPRAGWRAGLLTVDHGLQADSTRRAEAVAAWAAGSDLDPVEVLPVVVAGRPGGPEAAARQARYDALAAAAVRWGAAVVLLGHTRDDQAETVLLALARGAGPRGLAAMPARRESGGVAWLRPLLDVTRAQTRQACEVQKLDPWQDPHNRDPRYARARVRHTALPALIDALGNRVVDNLARTARQVAADNEALDALADGALGAARCGPDALTVDVLRELPDAVRTRAVHRWLRELGVPGAALSHRHVEAVDALVTDWHGQGPTWLPGGGTVTRRGGMLIAAGLADQLRSGVMGR